MSSRAQVITSKLDTKPWQKGSGMADVDNYVPLGKSQVMPFCNSVVLCKSFHHIPSPCHHPSHVRYGSATDHQGQAKAADANQAKK
ncbi:hypothetical protein Hypma_010382 [Hypsizygus marmoreus]|uniref:Uncharacterized protein n=1 Tax=Hypsizygus marmoreus TaxID=39966 RepID=A0A369JMI4_HYPMA|nr:hypothetical protein Hypma_010382 [Hypsizygus marmoreus]